MVFNQKKKESIYGGDSAVSFDSAVTPSSVSRLKAASMMKATIAPVAKGIKHNRKASVDPAALTKMPILGQSPTNGKPALKIN